MLILFALLLSATSALAAPAQYLVRVGDAVEVEARFVPGSDLVGMYFVESPDLENGSADLVEDLRATTVDGVEVTLEPVGGGDWRIVGADPQAPLVLRYRVRLEHDRYPWGPGIDEVAYTTEDGVFFTGRALFVVPLVEEANEGATVRFELPEGWRVSHPWAQDDGAAVAADIDQLVFNCFFMGTHVEEVIELDEFTMTLAVGTALADQRELFVQTMRPALTEAREIFGGMPRSDRYLAVINRYPRSDGGAYRASYSLLVDGPVDAGSSVVWGHGVVHEVLHFWNGQTLYPTDHRGEWFREGVTDYLTVLLRARLGQDPRQVTWRKLENAARRQVLARMMMGVTNALDAAGEQKQQNRMLVYGGGMLAAFALDLQIRAATDGERSLEDLLQKLYVDFALQDRAYTQDDLRAAASEVAGVDLSGFFDRHVQGAEMIDLAALAPQVGLRLTTMLDEFYLGEDPAAGTAELQCRRATFGGSD